MYFSAFFSLHVQFFECVIITSSQELASLNCRFVVVTGGKPEVESFGAVPDDALQVNYLTFKVVGLVFRAVSHYYAVKV